MSLVEKIKATVNCIDVAKTLGLPVNKPGDRVKSFRSNSKNNTSLMIQEEYWVDFGDGNKGGDCIQLWANIRDISNTQAIYEMKEHFYINTNFENDITKEELTYIKKRDKILDYYVNECCQKTLKKEKEFFKKRGFTDETIEKYKLGIGLNLHLKEMFDENIINDIQINKHYKRHIIPYIENGKIISLTSRGNNPKYMKLKKDKYAQNHIFGIDSTYKHSEVFIVEGELDALTAIQEGKAAIAISSLNFAKNSRQRIFKLLKNKTAIICLDRDKDKPECQAIQNLTKLFIKNRIKTKVIFFELKENEDKMDLNEFYCKHNNSLKDLPHPVPGAMFLYRFIKNNDDLREYITFIGKNLKEPEANMIARGINYDRFEFVDKKWGTDVLKFARQESEEDIILNLTQEKSFIYMPKDGFYTYNKIKTIWEPIDESYYGKEILDSTNLKLNGTKLSSILKLSKSLLADINIQFNKEIEWFNCRNCMVNVIENNKTKERTERDYVTICTEYDYNPKASTEEIHKFICEITNNDSISKRLLKQIMGYCLIKDVRFHKAFILYGKGRNGKSVFLDILAHLVGVDNVSHIAIHNLNEPFQLIDLKDKMINISSEMEADNNEGSDVFKKAVAGDAVTACKKGQDFLSFKPYAKLIFASNKIMSSQETTDGYMDRLSIINFPCKFVEKPLKSKPLEKQKITNYLEKFILNNMSGVLNYAIEGLQDLLENNGFVETKQGQKHKEQIKTMSNPIYAFLKQENLKGIKITEGALYDKYRQWCLKTNSGTQSQRKFLTRITETANIEYDKATASYLNKNDPNTTRLHIKDF